MGSSGAWSPAVTVRWQLGLLSSEGLSDAGGCISQKAPSHGWPGMLAVGRGLTPYPCGLLHKMTTETYCQLAMQKIYQFASQKMF